jgi:hypothetical protein
VLAFDQCGFGLRLLEGRDFYDQFPQWSRLGRMVHDVHRAVDFVEGGDGEVAGDPPPMDSGRIAVVGYGVGGTVGLFSAALDDRIGALASICGVTPWRGDGEDRPTGGIRRWWKWHALLPRLGLFRGREDEIPCDFDDLLAMIAPRPCLIEAPRYDRTADHGAVLGCIDRARECWDGAAGSEGLTVHTPPVSNQLLRKQQNRIVAWLEKMQMDG